ncbi:MAG: protein-L-isoaspartate(D-aspartate) O-methyltransferase [Gallionella sp.]|nr:protein-L-isoaspartate(D-aspartate) O-methyltransferase [Gallionella sp.]NCP79832.1 protein-L-isoaspartate(D-aspartate) O-methyltransferase [Gallionella sp.]NCS75207.1 protein-L-isoaspartate(D-aspartate) O-methyltransferase [Gallionella sp.]OIO12117.1 MAG: protein-L-isoaspartate O-methyltransferase [Gallionellaceae bacterium CG1_02_60_325]PIR09521.1 MAG: protein-L-isoaspartate O-methyltransferase [Gallionellaceae bacterium CG11_big_fil_rev_8_21_14_0_20_60_62]
MNLQHAGIGMTSARTRGRMIERLRTKGIRDEAVLAAIGNVPRHLFVDEALAGRAYDDVALPINYGQTISQPYIVARMIEVLRNGRQLGRVLEIGTGCGYQAAVLAQVAKEVYSVERIQPLHERARKLLRELKVRNVILRYADGSTGLADVAPFDGIIMACAAPVLLDALKEQLAIGGRMVLPLGTAEQFLYLVERTEKGFRETRLDAVKFVPLMGGKQ